MISRELGDQDAVRDEGWRAGLGTANPNGGADARSVRISARKSGRRIFLKAVLDSPSTGAIAITLLVLSLWIVRLNGPIDLRYDAGVYYTLGTSLARGEGYRIISEPGAPAGVQYPPGLPAFVAVHELLLRSADPTVVAPWLRRSYAVMFLLFALASLALARSHVPPGFALLAVVLCLLQVNTPMLSDMLFSELPFSLVSVGLALALETERLKSHPRAREIAGFVLASAGFLLRTAGIALLVAWVVEALARKQFRLAAIRVVLAALPFALWQAHVMHVRASDEYRHPAYEYQRAPYQFYNVTYGENLALADPFAPERGRADAAVIFARAKANLSKLPLALGEVVSESTAFWISGVDALVSQIGINARWAEVTVLAPLVVLAALMIYGMATLARRRAWLMVVFSVTSIGLACATPWPEQLPRYLAPLGPFLAIATVVGMVRTIDALRGTNGRWNRHAGRILLGILIGLTLTEQAFATASCFRYRYRSPVIGGGKRTWSSPHFFYYDNAWADLNRAADWIAKNSPPDGIVATNSPHLVYLRTGRRAVFPPMEPDAARARQLLEDVPVSFVIVDDLDFLDIARRYALPAVSGEAANWRLVRKYNKTKIYQHGLAADGPIATPRRLP